MSLALRFLLLPWSQNRPEKWWLTGLEWENVLWLRRFSGVIFLGVWKPMSSIVSAMDTAMQQVRILSERKDLFPPASRGVGRSQPWAVSLLWWLLGLQENSLFRSPVLSGLPCSQWLINVEHTDSLSPALDDSEGPSGYRITLRGPLTPLLDLRIC